MRAPLDAFMLNVLLFLLGAIGCWAGTILYTPWNRFLKWCAVYCLVMMLVNGWVVKLILDVI